MWSNTSRKAAFRPRNRQNHIPVSWFKGCHWNGWIDGCSLYLKKLRELWARHKEESFQLFHSRFLNDIFNSVVDHYSSFFPHKTGKTLVNYPVQRKMILMFRWALQRLYFVEVWFGCDTVVHVSFTCLCCLP